MKKISWILPIKTVSESNISEHWTKRRKRHRQQQFFVRELFLHEEKEIPIPCTVNLIRLAPRFLDKDDNLRVSFKWIKDEISECIFPEKKRAYIAKNGKIREIKGRLDDNPLITWSYDQEKSRNMAVRIEIFST